MLAQEKKQKTLSFWGATSVHKQGSKSNPQNYRGISIMNALLKVLSVMMNNR